ncbi:DegT/DnrJ/EryC1/StrS family aminotransferase [Streptomyces sp. NRRL S-350]|uniref:DegT/DnrJ/EryC1/StrS family aminotransferase n=1 Tax=Streptomyces sp. NRRL S-350 TaxID=1463902 RepID=UPI000692189F|nr:DegT/DnrJ/EryC1/StrS family aminotransferase [Streptomyces sp. NRRL S-350]
MTLDPVRPIDPADLPAWPQHDHTEREALERVLAHGQWWRAAGTENDDFEREFAAYNGAPYALAVTNGTVALELALRLHGIGPGDEVVVPAFTFISTSLAVQNVGATPVPADVDPETYCLTPEAVRAVLTPATRAVIPVHIAGHLADMPALAALAAERDLVVIQDAAHAQGGVWQGTKVGEFPSVACYSFQNGKLMTAGEGGALTLPDEKTYEQAYLMHTCGRPRGDTTYQHVTGGSNSRVSEFTAALLRAQLARLAEHTRIREERATLLDGLLKDAPGLRVQARDLRMDVNPHYMYLVALDPAAGRAARDRLVEELKAAGVPACVNFPPVYRPASFRAGPVPATSVAELAERCPVSEDLGAHGLWIHHRVLLAEPRVVERVAEVVTTLAERVTGAVVAR